jgi:hypothetical protein
VHSTWCSGATGPWRGRGPRRIESAGLLEASESWTSAVHALPIQWASAGSTACELQHEDRARSSAEREAHREARAAQWLPKSWTKRGRRTSYSWLPSCARHARSRHAHCRPQSQTRRCLANETSFSPREGFVVVEDPMRLASSCVSERNELARNMHEERKHRLEYKYFRKCENNQCAAGHSALGPRPFPSDREGPL